MDGNPHVENRRENPRTLRTCFPENDKNRRHPPKRNGRNLPFHSAFRPENLSRARYKHPLRQRNRKKKNDRHQPYRNTPVSTGNMPETPNRSERNANTLPTCKRMASQWPQSPGANMHSLTHAPTGPHAGPASPHSPSGKHPAPFRDILDRKTLPEKAAGRNGHPRQKTDTP